MASWKNAIFIKQSSPGVSGELSKSQTTSQDFNPSKTSKEHSTNSMNQLASNMESNQTSDSKSFASLIDTAPLRALRFVGPSKLSKQVVAAKPPRAAISHDIAPWGELPIEPTIDTSTLKSKRPVSFGNIEQYMSSLNLAKTNDELSALESPTRSLQKRDSSSTMHSATSASDFCKSYKKDRIYFACLIFNEKKGVLISKRGLLPSICLYGDDDESGELFNRFSSASDQFLYMRQTALDFEPHVKDAADPRSPFSLVRNNLLERLDEINEPLQATTKFRKNFYNAAIQFTDQFGLKNLGMMHREPIILEETMCIVVLNIISIKDDSVCDAMRSNGFSWKPAKSLDANVYSTLNPIWMEHELAFEQSLKCVKQGLYLCHFIIQVTVTGPLILVQRNHSNLPPLVKIRSRAEIDELEHEVLLSVMEDDSLIACNPFTRSIQDAFCEFQLSIQTPLSISQLVSVEPTPLGTSASQLILATIIPLGSKICAYDTSMFELISLNLFEIIHCSVYDSENYSRKMRLLKSSLTNLVKPKGNNEQELQTKAINLEMREGAKLFNDAKWTRQALSFGMKGKESVAEVDEETALKRMILPF